MDPTPTASRDAAFDGLAAEAVAALTEAGERIRALHERSRATYAEEARRWEALRERLDALERALRADDPGIDRAAARTIAAEHEALTAALAEHRSQLSRLEVVRRGIESAGALLERADGSRPESDGSGDDGEESLPVDLQLRIVEAREAERVRLAREVHDGPAQALANAIFGVDFVERVLERDPTEARAELARLRSHLQRDLVDVRGYIDQLRPPRLLELGLEGALRELATALATATGIEVETRLVEPDRLDEGARTIALRIAQEALQNVRKHAGARRVTVSSAHDGDAWSLEIADDGSGFDPDEVAGAGSRHYGLGFMRERARLIGGSVTVRSNPGAGTTVRLTIPMREV